MLAAFLGLFIRFDTFGGNKFSDVITRLQFIPSLMAHPAFWIATVAIVLVTFITGRVYCSILCPFGLIQDLLARLAFRKKTSRPGFMKNSSIIHFSIAILVLGSAFGGYMTLLNISEPFSLSGRLMANIIQPALSSIFRLFSSLFEGTNWLNRAKVNPIEPLNIIFGLIIFSILFFVVRKWGRIFCNTICPTGAILRLVSKFSFFNLHLNEQRCTSCGLCEKNCKSHCIEVESKTLDFSRCVVCLNCISVCNFSAIELNGRSYNLKTGLDFSQNRRALLASALSVTAASTLPAVFPLKPPGRDRILPPGAGSIKSFSNRCISCHLCLTACPSSVIITSKSGIFSGSLMQPQLNFDLGMCEQTCNTCSKICPTGALQPVTLEEKKTLKIAEVNYMKELCVVKTDLKDCGACAEHCPTKAVKMVPYDEKLMIPEVDPKICVGCGSCEHICPVRPIKAIVVKPISEQKHIKLPEPQPIKDSGSIEEFPF